MTLVTLLIACILVVAFAMGLIIMTIFGIMLFINLLNFIFKG